MPVLSFEVEYTGRPIVDLSVTISTKSARGFREDGRPIPGPLSVKALVDTGAIRSHVDLSPLTQMGLESVGEIEVYTASTGMAPDGMGLCT